MPKTKAEPQPRQTIVARLLSLNQRAKFSHPSPRYDELHGEINDCLDELVGR